MRGKDTPWPPLCSRRGWRDFTTTLSALWSPCNGMLGQLPVSQHTSLFIWPDTHKPLSRIHISKVLCGVIEEADPDHAPKGHEVRAMSATMAFLRHFSLDQIREHGQWALDRSFVAHYLDHTLEEVPCTSMAGPPSPPGPSSLT
ncbi:hypothetical protein E2C01_057075 [Portunus trituberculatus]|uniref:Uncharacterized protein n=1 Tax=Portunus trituberculatus TaxID=210409 RepID=A0A5B7GZ22_PORTR|nr:hypothetical protein [Portunus trituberculatus]